MKLAKPIILIGIIAGATLAAEHYAPRLLTELIHRGEYDTLPAVQPLTQQPSVRKAPEEILPPQPTKRAAVTSEAVHRVQYYVDRARSYGAEAVGPALQHFIDKYGYHPNVYMGGSRTTPISDETPLPDPDDEIGMQAWMETHGGQQ